MVNPYFCYGIAFSTALLLYFAGWSDLFPALSLPLLCFLIFTIILHILLGMRFRSKNIACFSKLEFPNDLAPWLVTIFLYILWSAEFFYEGGIPIVKILLKQPYDYKLFGIPTLHVFIVTFSSFYTVFLFHLFLSGRSLPILFLYILNLLAAILIYNRGMLLFNLFASASLLMLQHGEFSKRLLGWALPSVTILLFFFGILGSLRVSNESRMPYSNKGFLKTGGASQRFLNSGIPAEFFWAYIYTTSPLANLQANIMLNKPAQLNISMAAGWFTNEILFDSFSKRLNAYAGKTPPTLKTMHGPLNASTVYSGSYSHLAWPGLILMATFILVLPLLFIKMLPESSPFFLTAFALLNTIYAFMIFENTIRFTGLSFQMVYPLLLHSGISRLPWLKKVFSLR